MAQSGIVIRRKTWKQQLIPQAQQLFEKRVAFFLRNIGRDFQSGVLRDDEDENEDETHLLINMDSGKTLGFRGGEEVK